MSVVDRWGKPGSRFATRFMGRPDTATIFRIVAAGGSYVSAGSTACRLTPAGITAPAGLLATASETNQLAAIIQWHLNVPPGTDIRPRDRVLVQGFALESLGGYQPGSWNIADIHVLAQFQLVMTAAASIYTDDPNTGHATVLVKTGLSCWLANIGPEAAQQFDQRAELTERRQFFFDPTYIMPTVCSIETADPATGGALQRFNPVAGTFVAQAAPDGTVLTRRVDVRRTKV